MSDQYEYRKYDLICKDLTVERFFMYSMCNQKVAHEETKKLEPITVERSIWINATREQVWRAVTEPEHMAKWLLPALPWAQMTRDDNNILSVIMGAMGLEFALFEKVEPPHSLTSRSLPDKLIATTYTFNEERSGTRVTVTMRGFEALPADARHDRLAMSGAAWEQTLDNLNAHIVGAELPFPQAAVGALFGFWREGKEWIAVERSIWINAPRERVWRAITDPEQVQQWFSPGTQWHGTGLEVGGKLYVTNAETGGEMYVQMIEIVNPPQQLVTRSVPEAGNFPSVTNWMLAEENSGTRLTIIYSGYELMPTDVRQQRMDENSFGFGMMLQNIKASIEGLPLPIPGGF